MFVLHCYGANGESNLWQFRPNWRSIRKFLRRKADWVVRYEIVRYRNRYEACFRMRGEK